MLRLITGKAGSGKSRLCLNEIIQSLKEQPLGPPLIFLVPEQATFGNEMELVGNPDITGSFRAKVLSFGRLYNLIEQQETGASLPWLDDSGKAMLISQSIEKFKDSFVLFNQAAKHKGFVDSLVGIISELEKYAIDPDAMLEVKAKMQDPLTAGKLHDLALIYQDILTKISGKYLDEALSLNRLSEMISANTWLEQAEIWVDGFSEFNAAQLQVLKALLEKCQRVSITLCGDAAFPNISKTREKLLDLVDDSQQIEILELKVNWRHENNPALSMVEQSFAGEKTSRENLCGRNVQIFACGRPREELDFVAREIIRLCCEEGYKMSEIGVIARNLMDYQELVNRTFEEYDIPYFTDTPGDLFAHPLCQVIAGALETLENNWHNSGVFRYLKSGLIDITIEETDILEDYALANGIFGSKWQQAGEWTRYYFNNKNLLADEKTDLEIKEEIENLLAEVNQIAARGIEQLSDFSKSLKGKSQDGKYEIKSLVLAIRNLLVALDVESKLQNWAADEMDAGNQMLAAKHQQAMAKIDSLLKQLIDFIGDTWITIDYFLTLLQDGIRNLNINTIPPVLDEVVVADINRSRLQDLKVTFVIGCNQGVFPARMVDDSLFNSLERQQLKDLGLELAAGQREQQLSESYLVYIAMTRATERLYVTYVDALANGEEAKPSAIVNNLLSLFSDLTVCPSDSLSNAHHLVSAGVIISKLATKLNLSKEQALTGEKLISNEDQDFWLQVYSYLQQQGRFVNDLQALNQGLLYQVDKSYLTRDNLHQLYKSLDNTSVSRLETFNTCPCKYYMRYGLSLEEPAEYKIRPLDIGVLYHYVLAELIQQFVNEKVDWNEISLEMIIPRVQQILEEFNVVGLGDILNDSNKNKYLRNKIITVVSTGALTIGAQLAKGEFVPIACEVSFGGESDILPYKVVLTDGTEVKIRGQIDRIDKARGTNQDYYRIVDYKMSDKKLTPSDIYYGLNWQLPVYMQTLMTSFSKNGSKTMPAGMFYVPIRQVIQSVQSNKSLVEANHKMSGLVILDYEAVALGEKGLLELGGSASTMGVRVKKDGSFGRTKEGITHGQYQALQNHVDANMKQRLEQIMAGEISQKPVKNQGRLACEYCDYNSLCAIDRELSMDFSEIKDLSNQEVFELLGVSEE